VPPSRALRGSSRFGSLSGPFVRAIWLRNGLKARLRCVGRSSSRGGLPVCWLRSRVRTLRGSRRRRREWRRLRGARSIRRGVPGLQPLALRSKGLGTIGLSGALGESPHFSAVRQTRAGPSSGCTNDGPDHHDAAANDPPNDPQRGACPGRGGVHTARRGVNGGGRRGHQATPQDTRGGERSRRRRAHAACRHHLLRKVAPHQGG
jgi:hypothetical protein